MYVVENLKQDAEYIIRVAAVTESGSGKVPFKFCKKSNLELFWANKTLLAQYFS